jgi:hypothetical protein
MKAEKMKERIRQKMEDKKNAKESIPVNKVLPSLSENEINEFLESCDKEMKNNLPEKKSEKKQKKKSKK